MALVVMQSVHRHLQEIRWRATRRWAIEQAVTGCFSYHVGGNEAF